MSQRYDDVTGDAVMEQPVLTPSESNRRSAWIAVGCIILVIAAIVLVVVFVPLSVSNQNTNAQHIQTLDERLAALHQSDFETDGVYSMARVYSTGLPHTLALCHIDVYRQQNGALLRAHDQTAASDVYGLKTRFTIQLNVAAQALGVKQRQRLDGEHYQLINYEVESSFTEFSTVKLVESALDLHKKSLKVRREYLACTNNPGVDTRRCDYVYNDVLAFNNTRLLTMDAATPDKKKPKNETQAGTTLPQRPTRQPEDGETGVDLGIDLTPETKESVKALGNEISQLRVYHIQFYKAEKQAKNSDSDFKETLVLTVLPHKC